MSIKDVLVRGKIINLVRERRVLWDPRHPKYKDPRELQKNWLQISLTLGYPPRLCQKTWKYLRDFYMSKRKRASVGVQEEKQETRDFMVAMAFIDDVVRTRESHKPHKQPLLQDMLVPVQVMESPDDSGEDILPTTSYDTGWPVMESPDGSGEDILPSTSYETSWQEGEASYSSPHSSAQDKQADTSGIERRVFKSEPHFMTDFSHLQQRNDFMDDGRSSIPESYNIRGTQDANRDNDPDSQWLMSLRPLLKDIKTLTKKERVKLKIHSMLVEELESQSCDNS